MDNQPTERSGTVDAVVVGAGFAGLYMIHRLVGLGLSVRGFEAAPDVGGTWYWNRYPGARCDVQSLDYSYSFSPELEREWDWTDRYATQPEILRYIDHVAERFDLRRHIRFETRVTSLVYDEDSARWTVTTDTGETVTTQFCIMATGCLSVPKEPEVPGIDRFAGRIYHTARWPHDEVDFTGQRVGVIGTGSSGIQAIPELAGQAAQLTVFQRTANYSQPAHHAPLEPETKADRKAHAAEYRSRARATGIEATAEVPTVSALAVDADERERTYETRWGGHGLVRMAAYNDLLTLQAANDTLASFIRSRIHEVVKDPVLADTLSPTDHAWGTKRPCLDDGYFATFNRANVTLVDLRKTPLVELTAAGVRTSDAEYSFDSIVFATGFDAMTGALLRVDIRGRGGRSLAQKWADGPRTYLGLSVAGFPNLFTITGPQSPSVLTNMVLSIEQHVDWIADCIEHLRSRGLTAVEASEEAEDGWVQHALEVADLTLYPQTSSWYTGANVPGKPRVVLPYLGGLALYRERCDAVVAAGYEGFILSS